MSLDLYFEEKPVAAFSCPHCGGSIPSAGEEIEVYSTNITHNLHPMFDQAGVGDLLWADNDNQIAGEILPALEKGLELLKSDPARFSRFNAANGWGLYIHAVPWLEGVVNACREHPRARIRVSR